MFTSQSSQTAFAPKQEWYVLLTKPKAEKKSGRQLSEWQIENYVPVQKQLHQWHDRKKWVETPILFSYIFVKISEKFKNDVFKVSGIRKFVSIGGKICTLSNEEIDRVRRICNYEGALQIQEGDLQVGEEVEILSGHFVGFRGHIVGGNLKQKVKLSIPGFSSFAIVEIECSCLKIAN